MRSSTILVAVLLLALLAVTHAATFTQLKQQLQDTNAERIQFATKIQQSQSGQDRTEQDRTAQDRKDSSAGARVLQCVHMLNCSMWLLCVGVFSSCRRDSVNSSQRHHRRTRNSNHHRARGE
jgi:hypothetical protein